MKPRIPSIRWERNIDVVTESAGTAEFIDIARSGIQRPSVLMKRDKQRIRIVPVDIFRAVAVVAISVDDGDAHVAVPLPRIFETDRLDIDNAKASIAVHDTLGMMPRRSDKRKSLVSLTAQDSVKCSHDTSGGNQM